MSRLGRGMLLALAALSILGCEQVFSTNLFSGLDRDPSKLSLDQQIVYAQSALASGDTGKMAKAYDALSDSIEGTDDAELNLLAADLALGASDLQGVFDEIVEVALGEETDLSNQDDLAAGLDGSLGDVDYGYVAEAQAQVDAAVANGGAVSEEQYLLVTVGLIMQAADGEGSVSDLNDGNTAAIEAWVTAANDDLEARGESSDYLTDLESFLTGL
ncbi:MAG: hypothetical protein ACOCW6_10740 [Spirochaetota bacterium]